MKRLEPSDVASRSVAMLGLDPKKHAITSTESLSAALRRAAGFLCPCAGSTLIRSVIEPMRGLVRDMENARALAENTLEQLISLGDLLEYRDLEKSGSVVLYAAPCGFVQRTSGTVSLLGISADQFSALPPDLEARIEVMGCTRLLRPRPGENLRDDLLEIGLIEIAHDRWTIRPPDQKPNEFVEQHDRRLLTKPSSCEVPGLVVLDPDLPTHFYRGRWTDAKDKSGRFVARRDQAYGAPLWCYVEVKNGQATHLLDLPAPNSRWRGCDEAWHLQMAIDACRGRPQLFDIRQQPESRLDLLLYSPIPMWAQRKWDAVGERIDAKGCLIAFRFHDSEIEEECLFAQSAMWLGRTTYPIQREE